MDLEFEKRYLADYKDIPFSQASKRELIEDMYTHKDEKMKVRVRRIYYPELGISKYFHCTKYRFKSNIREEIETEILEGDYLAITQYMKCPVFSKERVYIPISFSLMASIDIEKGIKTIVEVEFENADQMNSFVPPDWFGEDITNTNRYSFKTTDIEELERI